MVILVPPKVSLSNVTLLHHNPPALFWLSSAGREADAESGMARVRPQVPRQRQVVRVVAIAISGLVHIALLLALVQTSVPPPSAGATNLEAITISMVSDDSLTAATAGGPFAPVAPPPSPGSKAQEQPNDKPLDTPIEALPKVPLPEVKKTLETLATPTADDTTMPAIAPAPLEKPASVPATIASEGGETSPQTAVLSNAATDDRGEGGASQGQIEEFAKSVALVLARGRPKGIGKKGRVDIEFVLSEQTGALEAARVANTSGHERLDAMALASVRKAAFPTPPPRLTTRQLTFRVPFTFE